MHKRLLAGHAVRLGGRRNAYRYALLGLALGRQRGRPLRVQRDDRSHPVRIKCYQRKLDGEQHGRQFALDGRAISLDGAPGGVYVVAAQVRPDGRVLALQLTGRDAAGTPAGLELLGVFVVETPNSASQAAHLGGAP
jgi:hypothetical protein